MISKDEKIFKVSRHKGIILVCGILVSLALSFFNLSLYISSKINPQVMGARDLTTKEIEYWTTFLESYPTYKDGWLELAKLEYQRGNLEKARLSLQKAENVDPNSEEVKRLKGVLGF